MSCTKSVDQKETVFYCDCCFRNITKNVFINCNDCEFDICISCFQNGIETEIHKNSHKYRLVGHLDVEIDEGWNLLEYLLFINGLVCCGIGNYTDLSHFIQTKTEKEVKRKFYEITEFTNNTKGEANIHTVSRSDPNDAVLVNYMPEREDFEIEQYNDYEVLLQHTEIDGTETEINKSLKNHIFYYTNVVNKIRNNWKNFVLDRKLIDMEEIVIKDQTAYGVFISKHKWLLQFLSKNDFNKAMSSLFKEECAKNLCESEGAKKLNEIKQSLEDFKQFALSPVEKTLCITLKIDFDVYLKIKRFVLETFASKKKLKDTFYSLFKEKDMIRADVLYKWFWNNNVVHE